MHRRWVAFDVETTVPRGESPERALDPWYPATRIFAYAVCDGDGSSIVRRFDVDGGAYGRARLVELLNDSDVTLVAHNCHFEIAMLIKENLPVPPPERWEDTMLLCKLCNNLEPSVALDSLAIKYAPRSRSRVWREAWDAVSSARKTYGTYDLIPRQLMDVYQRADVEATAMLYSVFSPALRERTASWREYREVEIPLAWETAHMEARGIAFARDKAEALLTELRASETYVRERSYELLGRFVNLNSGKQLQQLLYRDMRLPIPYFTEEGNTPAVDKLALDMIEERHSAANAKLRELIDLIHRQRSATKGIAIVEGYKRVATADDIVHPHINTCLAATLRQSSENPNLQNVSNEVSLRTRYPVPARRCFRARPGYVLMPGDYQGIEMRLLVQGTRSARLIKLVEAGFDFHDAMACNFYGARYADELDKAKKKGLRSAAKNGRFCRVYGGGLKTLAKTLMLSIPETRAGIERDDAEYPEFAAFMQSAMSSAERDGYVETFFGHRLNVPPDRPHAACDYTIQGTAAAVLKRAQVRVAALLREQDIDAHMLLPVHDELVFEYPWIEMRRSREWRAEIGRAMTRMDGITVPLAVEWELSVSTWDATKELRA